MSSVKSLYLSYNTDYLSHNIDHNFIVKLMCQAASTAKTEVEYQLYFQPVSLDQNNVQTKTISDQMFDLILKRLSPVMKWLSRSVP